ncbi:MAG: hypothetical protein IPM45_16325 [Acidimicrobiales bacterium]|nr:hypothetical protein [Acidimicrobiales bacterium]
MGAGAGSAGDGGAGGFELWAADAAVDEARAARVERHWMRRLAEEEATLAGTLLDLAERDVRVALATVTGRVHAGHLTTVGADVLAVRTTPGALVLVALRSVAWVRPAGPPDASGPTGAAAGDRAGGPRLADLLAARVGERPRLVVRAGAAEASAGELLAVGRDVLTLGLDGGGVAYVSLDSLDEVLLESG